MFDTSVFENKKFSGLKAGLDLEKKKFYNSTFVDCDFYGSVFDECYFSNCQFIRCKFDCCEFIKSIFHDCILNTVSLQSAYFYPSSRIEGCALIEVDVKCAHFSKDVVQFSPLRRCYIISGKGEKQYMAADGLLYIGPIGSRLDTLNALILANGDFLLSTGCQIQITPEQFKLRLKEKVQNQHCSDYYDALSFIEKVAARRAGV